MKSWPIAIAILCLGLAALAASLRERRQARARLEHAPKSQPPEDVFELSPRDRAPGDPDETTGGTTTTADAPGPVTIEEARARVRAASTPTAKREVLRAAAKSMPKSEARKFVAEIVSDAAQDVTLRTAAVLLLPTVTEPEAAAETADVLAQLLADQSFPADYLAVKALADLGDPRVAPILENALRTSPDASTRIASARALAAFPGSEGTLRDAVLSDASENVRLAAFDAYCTLATDDAEFARQVEALADCPPTLRAAARRRIP